MSGKFPKRRYTFGVLTTLQKDIFRSHYHAGLLSGIFRRCGETKIDLKLIPFPSSGYSDLPAIFCEHSLDGLIILTWRWIHPKIVQMIENAHENRVVVVNDPVPGLDVNMVCTDVDAGMRLAVRHLAQKKIRNIGLLHGPEEVCFKPNGKTVCFPFIDTRLKRSAFVSALKGKKITVKRNWIRSASANSEEAGYRVMKKWLREKNLPQGILCGNDDLAFGVLKALKDSGLECPGDIAVIGFDDNDYAKRSTPSLTTVRQPLVKMGKDTVDILIAQVSKVTGAAKRKNYLPKLIVRKSA